MKTALKALTVFAGGALALAFVVIASPVFVLLFPYIWFRDRKFKKGYEAYLRSLEGTKIFCYNSKSNSHSYIKHNLLPLLEPEVEVVYLNGRDPVTGLEKQYIAYALQQITQRKGFPYLLKVEQGRLFDYSIHQALYNTMSQGKDLRLVVESIKAFYRPMDAERSKQASA